MTPATWIVIAVAGSIGAPARFLLDRFVQGHTRGSFPWGTFAVNMSGSFILGVVTGLGMHGHLSKLAMSAFGTGFCGAFTTFSTFSFETTRLIEVRRWRAAAGFVGCSVGIGLTAAAVGLYVAANIG
ncbi:MAG: fluoride efflux transporter CrcB [Actinobacteria bacterium]|nr:fluoride efflux transporter CrcB [Actinomycetota bacterium]